MSVKIVNVKISMPSSGGGGSSTIKPVVPPEPPEPETTNFTWVDADFEWR